MARSEELYNAALYVYDNWFSRLRTVDETKKIIAEDHNSVADTTKKYMDTMGQSLPVTPRSVKDLISGEPTAENYVYALDLVNLKTLGIAVMDAIESLFGDPYTTDSEWPSIYSAISGLGEPKFGDWGSGYFGSMAWNVPMKYALDLTNLILRYGPAPPPPSTAATSTKAYSVDTPMQVKGAFAAGKYWQFFTDGTNLCFTSTDDGVTWLPKTTVRACAWGREFSIKFDGTYFHYTYCNIVTGGNLIYRRGLPNGDGTIDWQAEQNADSVYDWHYFPTIEVDSEGYPWCAFMGWGDGYPYATKSSTKDGTWVTEVGFPFELDNSRTGYWCQSVVALSGGKVYALFENDFTEVIRGRLWTGSWSGIETVPASHTSYYTRMRITAIGDDLHFVYKPIFNNEIIYLKRTYGVGWGSEEIVTPNTVWNSAAVICANASSGLLVVFWHNMTTNHVYYRKKPAGGSWDASDTDWIDESVDKFSSTTSFTCWLKSISGKMGLSYSTKKSSPYKVRFAILYA